MWSVGCIFYELCTNQKLFPGDSEIDQINRIFRTLGTPTYEDIGYIINQNWKMYPKFNLRDIFPDLQLDDYGYDLLMKMFIFDPLKRITAF